MGGGRLRNRRGFTPDGEVTFAGREDGGAEAEFGQQVLRGFFGGRAIGDADAGEGFGFVLIRAQDGDGAQQCE